MLFIEYEQYNTVYMSFDEMKDASKTLHVAEMFILGSILEMRRWDKDWEGDLQLTARKVKVISEGLYCKLKKIKTSTKKEEENKTLKRKLELLEPEMKTNEESK